MSTPETEVERAAGEAGRAAKGPTYRVRADGRLDASWSARLGGMVIECDRDATTLTGSLRDQSALMGVLNALHMLRLTVTSVERLEAHP